MKTQNNTQETVNEQVRRMILRGSTVIVGLALISLAVNAQDLWNQFSNNSSYGKMAVMMNNQASETKKTDAVFEAIDAEIAIKLNHSAATFAFEAEQENALQLEAWMTDEALFTSSLDLNAVDTEAELTIENWMTDAKNFSIAIISESVEIEKQLEIEPWMSVEEYFNSVETLTNTESALDIENWMLNSHNFNTQNEPMQLEAWMTDNQYWNNN
ncbi:MAG: hypothetical protein K0M40_15725 [Prolixibacteraceae bacterium]|nr:hypothetical protein [Prolixibacteraceae bacterium]